jgi:hypothetical protein
VRGLLFPGLVVFVTALIGVWLSVESRVQSAPAPAPLAGVWTLNKELSDKPAAGTPPREGENGGRHRGGGMGGMGGGRRGGGMGRGGAGGGGMSPDADAANRMRDAMRDIMTAPARLTIVETDSMVVITSGEGRVTRLSPDGKKIKDDNTKIERKTKWDEGRLVSEISGLGPGKILETYGIDPELHHLVVTITAEGSRAPVISERRVYDKQEN